MNTYRTYFTWLITILAVAISGLLSCAFYLEPLSGGLTRLGGYSENRFGWQNPQQRLEEPLYQFDKYDRYYDVVVFGDSFTYKTPGEQTDEGSYWPNFFVNHTGLSLVSFHYSHSDLDNVLQSEKFKRFPPRLFIYEVVERDIVYVPNYGNEDDTGEYCETDAAIQLELPLRYSPLGLQPQQYSRSEVYLPNQNRLFGVDLATTSNFIKKNMLRSFADNNYTKVMNLDLSRNDLFSNKTSDELLIYSQDVEKYIWSEKKLQNTYCKLVALQNLVQSNGMTFFVLMIAPDKLTAYSDYLIDRQYADLSKIDEIASSGLHSLRLDQRMKKEVVSGTVDLYLPNDTHWGFEGHKVAADTLVDYLINVGVLNN